MGIDGYRMGGKRMKLNARGKKNAIFSSLRSWPQVVEDDEFQAAHEATGDACQPLLVKDAVAVGVGPVGT